MNCSRKIQAEHYRELAMTFAAMADRARSDEERAMLRRAESGYITLAEAEDVAATITVPAIPA